MPPPAVHRPVQEETSAAAQHYETRCAERPGPELDRVDPPKGPYQWQDWSFAWEVTDVGRHSLRARATDAAGNVQPDVPPWNRLGYGNNAVEVLYVDVR